MLAKRRDGCKITAMKMNEVGPCQNCPRNISRRNWLSKILKPKLTPDPNCAGPVILALEAQAVTDYEHGYAEMTLLRRPFCPADVTVPAQGMSDNLVVWVEDRYSQAHAEVKESQQMRWASMTPEQQQAALDEPVYFVN